MTIVTFSRSHHLLPILSILPIFCRWHVCFVCFFWVATVVHGTSRDGAGGATTSCRGRGRQSCRKVLEKSRAFTGLGKFSKQHGKYSKRSIDPIPAGLPPEGSPPSPASRPRFVSAITTGAGKQPITGYSPQNSDVPPVPGAGKRAATGCSTLSLVMALFRSFPSPPVPFSAPPFSAQENGSRWIIEVLLQLGRRNTYESTYIYTATNKAQSV